MSEIKTKTVSEDDGITVKIADILAHEPVEGNVFYAWVDEKHPRFEIVRSDLYGWATHRGIEPREFWSGIVPAAQIPFKWKAALDESYRVRWVTEKQWRNRCKDKDNLKEIREERRKDRSKGA